LTKLLLAEDHQRPNRTSVQRVSRECLGLARGSLENVWGLPEGLQRMFDDCQRVSLYQHALGTDDLGQKKTLFFIQSKVLADTEKPIRYLLEVRVFDCIQFCAAQNCI
jgi:hypothetical protein